MDKYIINSIDTLSKWILDKGVSQIGYEWCKDSVFVTFTIDNIITHINIFLEYNECLINIYNNKEHILSDNGTMEKCLTQLKDFL